MYEEFYGLKERPFDLSPNPRFLFLSRGHREALLHLRYGLSGRPGITLIVGDAGTGKTTLVRAALHGFGQIATTAVHLSNPTLSREEFCEYLAHGFELGADAMGSKARFLQALDRRLADHTGEGTPLALVVDEAQSLPHELLEEVRLLTNTEGRGRSIAVALVGQPELAERLNRPDLRQLKQRVALRCALGPLDHQETAAYIAARVRTAGGQPETLFTREAVLTIHKHSGGLPRLISVICDNVLVAGFATDMRPVGSDLVLEVCRDFDCGAPPGRDGVSAPVPRSGTPDAAVNRRNAGSKAIKEHAPMFSAFGRPRRFSFF